MTALVEVFDREHVTGWVETAGGAPRVGLFVDDLEVDSTYAIDAAERHAEEDVRVFRFALADVWRFIGPGNRLTVRLDGTPVPIAGQGMFFVTETSGASGVGELRARLDAGEVFSRDGVLQLSKSLDVDWQAAVLALYARVRAVVREALGADAFLAYGTLLGAVREDGFIGHDLDFDCAFVSSAHDGPGAGRDLQNLAFTLIDRGYAVRATPSSISVADAAAPSVAVTVYHLYFDGSGDLQFPHGIAGTTSLAEADWTGTKETDFAAASVALPADAEAVLETTYGAGWRSPNPGFSWARDRRLHAAEGLLPAPVVEEIYWADFYARTTYTSGSTFCALVLSRADVPATVVDIGCGDGRDSYAFATAGKTKVTGLDRSHVGVRQAARKADQLGLGDRLSFTACDVGDADRLRSALQTARDGSEPMAFYARFFLHSIPEDVQRVLMGVVAECAQPGDYFAAEFRTDKDAAIEKVHGNHYRRFQNGPAFGRALQEVYGFTPLLEQEGNGFSPYQGEDPQLYRVIACRR